MRAAVVGAGVAGRLTALWLQRRGCAVTLYDAGDFASRDACSYAAAGMLAPVAEAVSGEAGLVSLGIRSLRMWPGILATLPLPVTFRQEGSLALVREPDLGDLVEYRERLQRKAGGAECRLLSEAALAELEPALGGTGLTGVYLPDEGQIDNLEAMAALGAAVEREGITLRLRTKVSRVEAHRIETAAGTERFDVAVDCRGLGALEDLPELRGVRGETVLVHAPEVRLTRPVRVLHPRYPVYVVPRGRDTYVIGATVVESESRAPVTVKAALELLTGVYNLHPGFRFAHVVGLVANARPAFLDNWPRVHAQPGLVRVNGLFRHGFLLAPLLTEVVATVATGGTVEPELAALVREG